MAIRPIVNMSDSFWWVFFDVPATVLKCTWWLLSTEWKEPSHVMGSSLRSTWRNLVWGSEDPNNQAVAWPFTGQIWEADQSKELGGRALVPILPFCHLLLWPSYLSSRHLWLLHSSTFSHRGRAILWQLQEIYCLALFLLNFCKSVPLLDVFHHLNCPFLKLFLLNFYDSSRFLFRLRILLWFILWFSVWQCFFSPSTICLFVENWWLIHIQIHTQTHTHTLGWLSNLKLFMY